MFTSPKKRQIRKFHKEFAQWQCKELFRKVCDVQNCFAYEIYCLFDVFVAVAVVAEDANSWYI